MSCMICHKLLCECSNYPSERTMSKAIGDIIDERRRQQWQEKFTLEYDIKNNAKGNLALAAASYAQSAAHSLIYKNSLLQTPLFWPFDNLNLWKPCAPRRDLVKAAALLVAQIEVIDAIEFASDESDLQKTTEYLNDR